VEEVNVEKPTVITEQEEASDD